MSFKTFTTFMLLDIIVNVSKFNISKVAKSHSLKGTLETFNRQDLVRQLTYKYKLKLENLKHEKVLVSKSIHWNKLHSDMISGFALNIIRSRLSFNYRLTNHKVSETVIIWYSPYIVCITKLCWLIKHYSGHELHKLYRMYYDDNNSLFWNPHVILMQ